MTRLAEQRAVSFEEQLRAEWAYEVEKMEHMKEEIRKDLDVGVEG